MKNEKQLIGQLERHRTPAPEGFADRVMEALPHRRTKRAMEFWPTHGRWIAPAFAGAVAALLVVFAVGHFNQPAVAQPQVAFHFELHAPGADRVELLGTFNNWKSGDIVLNGPDASGHWTADVMLPEGRHEYVFLVDGERWVADPKAATHRPDGFGRVNTVIKVYDDDNNA
ncbi:MAG: isoamylase early set domain-containing protein [Kiritimatiellales bacterium]|nr:isoamylase early set domain-containing protein [Kiritimatiellales bacterium]